MTCHCGYEHKMLKSIFLGTAKDHFLKTAWVTAKYLPH